MVMIVSPFFYLFIFSSCRLSWHALLQCLVLACLLSLHLSSLSRLIVQGIAL